MGEAWTEAKAKAFASQAAVQAPWCELFHTTDVDQ